MKPYQLWCAMRIIDQEFSEYNLSWIRLLTPWVLGVLTFWVINKNLTQSQMFLFPIQVFIVFTLCFLMSAVNKVLWIAIRWPKYRNILNSLIVDDEGIEKSFNHHHQLNSEYKELRRLKRDKDMSRLQKRKIKDLIAQRIHALEKSRKIAKNNLQRAAQIYFERIDRTKTNPAINEAIDRLS